MTPAPKARQFQHLVVTDLVRRCRASGSLARVGGVDAVDVRIDFARSRRRRDGGQRHGCRVAASTTEGRDVVVRRRFLEIPRR